MSIRCRSVFLENEEFKYLRSVKYVEIELDCPMPDNRLQCTSFGIVLYEYVVRLFTYPKITYEGFVGVPLVPMYPNDYYFLVILKTNEVLGFPTSDYLMAFVDNISLARSVTNFEDFMTLVNL